MTKEIQETIRLSKIQDNLSQAVGWLEVVKSQVAANSEVLKNRGDLIWSLAKCTESLRILVMQLHAPTTDFYGKCPSVGGSGPPLLSPKTLEDTGPESK